MRTDSRWLFLSAYSFVFQYAFLSGRKRDGAVELSDMLRIGQNLDHSQGHVASLWHPLCRWKGLEGLLARGAERISQGWSLLQNGRLHHVVKRSHSPSSCQKPQLAMAWGHCQHSTGGQTLKLRDVLLQGAEDLFISTQIILRIVLSVHLFKEREVLESLVSNSTFKILVKRIAREVLPNPKMIGKVLGRYALSIHQHVL